MITRVPRSSAIDTPINANARPGASHRRTRDGRGPLVGDDDRSGDEGEVEVDVEVENVMVMTALSCRRARSVHEIE
ncbi:hypothetical protein YM304_42410 [Ilumatobacter coccineus YM16-304]|uniref:Uncharacterized protein n=1 Tax=Ilumatobacter coccineus (strain NBRC 103263 / KCTC 29153 / YM16-304) TaxID=1313172 RepID=A0A6C7EHW6_ILUCY|nr:hypothetical protein YM304_42410 [Ilumatobacter coccineus YM16-304]